MTWPTGSVNTANTDASTDSPANARADFLDLEQKVNQIIAHGAPVLQAGTQTIDGSKTFSSSLSVPNASASGHAVNKGQMDAADGLRLLKSSNLSDLANAATALANLGGIASSVFTGSNQSIGGNGYQKIPGGLIIQWGSVNIGDVPGLVGATASVSFPIAFPSAVLASFVSVYDGTSGSAGSTVLGSVYSETLSGIDVSAREFTGSIQNVILRWFAIGF